MIFQGVLRKQIKYAFLILYDIAKVVDLSTQTPL